MTNSMAPQLPRHSSCFPFLFDPDEAATLTRHSDVSPPGTFSYNPQYVVNLTDPDEEDDEEKCTVIVALMQKNRRAQRKLGLDCLTIGFAIYHVRAGCGIVMVGADWSKITHYHHICISFFKFGGVSAAV